MRLVEKLCLLAMRDTFCQPKCVYLALYPNAYNTKQIVEYDRGACFSNPLLRVLTSLRSFPWPVHTLHSEFAQTMLLHRAHFSSGVKPLSE